MKTEHLIETIKKQTDPGLFQGKMGIALYAYCVNDKRITTKLADRLIDQLYKDSENLNLINISQGLPGIGLGLDYLMRHNYLEGNSDTILEDIDNSIFRNTAYLTKNDKVQLPGLTEVLLYLSIRLKYGLKRSANRILFELLATKLINYIYTHRTEGWYNEPIPFSLYYSVPMYLVTLARIHRLNIYTTRIEKILKEMQPFLFAQLPLLHSNKLTLLYAIRAVCKQIQWKEWEDYAQLLSTQLSIESILSEEMKNKNVLFTDGVAGIYLLLYLYNQENEEKLQIDHQLFHDRIEASLIWQQFEADDEFLKAHVGLNGYLGLQLLLIHLQSKLQ